MGIRGLTQIASALRSKKKLQPIDLIHFQNQIWAIDASLFLYRARSMSVLHNNESIIRKPLKFRNILPDVPFEFSHLIGIIDIFCQLISNKIIPLFVFDGEPPAEKNSTIYKRRLEKIKLQKKIELVEKSISFETPKNFKNSFVDSNKSWAQVVRNPNSMNNSSINLNDDNNTTNNNNTTNDNNMTNEDVQMTKMEFDNIKNNIDKYKQQIDAAYLEPQHVYQTQKLCDIIGIPYLQSKSEAEVSCAILQKNNIVHAIYTADSDVLVYGCTKMVRKIINNEKVDLLDHDFILQELQLTNEQFIRFCILMGCDFCDGLIHNINNITPFCILKYIKNPELQDCDTLFNYFQSSMGDEWVAKAKRAYEIYINNHYIQQPELQQIQFHNITKNFQELQDLFQNELSLQGPYIHRVIQQILDSYNFFFNNNNNHHTNNTFTNNTTTTTT